MLFEARGRGAAYDAHHPDEYRHGNFRLILCCDEEPIGVIRVDVEGGRALFRRVAIREDVQRRGHGTALLSLAEAFAIEKGCDRVQSFVDPGAIGFYDKCGFTRAVSPDSAVETVLMQKRLLSHRS